MTRPIGAADPNTSCLVQVKQKLEANWRDRKVQILVSVAAVAIGIIVTKVLLTLGVLLAALGSVSWAYHLFKPASVEEPREITPPPLTPVLIKEVENIESVKASSAPFDIKKISISEGLVRVVIVYAAGTRRHDFTLYYSAKLKYEDRFSPSQVFLHHNSNGEGAESCRTTRLDIELSQFSPMMQFHIVNWAKANTPRPVG